LCSTKFLSQVRGIFVRLCCIIVAVTKLPLCPLLVLGSLDEGRIFSFEFGQLAPFNRNFIADCSSIVFLFS
jgi:hypothetical protein